MMKKKVPQIFYNQSVHNATVFVYGHISYYNHLQNLMKKTRNLDKLDLSKMKIYQEVSLEMDLSIEPNLIPNFQ